ncbi:MAG: hypothetical protein ACHQ5A_11835 [Opitutales bacterium]
MTPASRARIALIGSGLWLLPVLSCAAWYAASPGSIVPPSGLRDALGLLVAGLGAWMLMVVLLYRGRLRHAGAFVGAGFVAMNLAADAFWLTLGSNATSSSYLIEMAPTYLALGAFCAILGRFVGNAARS